MQADDAAEAATMLVRHSRDVYGNGETGIQRRI